MSSSESPARQINVIRTVGIVGRPHSPNADDAVRDAVAWLTHRGIGTIVEAETARRARLSSARTFARDGVPPPVDLLLVLGGDGTLLSVAHPVAHHAPATPILAVNCGSLGFLTEITRPEMCDALASVVAGTAGIDDRRMLRARVLRDGGAISERLILNDVVLGRSARSGIIDFSISVGDQFVTSSRADGMVVATPTGSTAYNLAAGGPIVHPTVDAMVITPLAPHMLTNRPIVLTDTIPVSITPILDRDDLAATVSFDGQLSVDLEPGDAIVVDRAEQPLRVIRAERRHYFAVLREKLKWGER